MQTSRHTSLAALATHHGSGEVVGLRFGDRAEVEVIGTAERLTVDEFARRYPAGVILWWHDADDEPL